MKIKNKILKFKEYLNKERKYTNADDLMNSIIYIELILLNLLTLSGINTIIKLLEQISVGQ